MPISEAALQLIKDAKNVSNQNHATVIEVLIAQVAADFHVASELLVTARAEYEAEAAKEGTNEKGCCCGA